MTTTTNVDTWRSDLTPDHLPKRRYSSPSSFSGGIPFRRRRRFGAAIAVVRTWPIDRTAPTAIQRMAPEETSPPWKRATAAAHVSRGAPRPKIGYRNRPGAEVGRPMVLGHR